MLFSSMSFLTIFLPITIIVYFVLGKRHSRNVVLLVSSLFFYAWGEPSLILLMVMLVGFDYIMVIWIDHYKHQDKINASRILFTMTLLSNIGVLAFFKYANFIIQNINLFGFSLPKVDIHLPIGISFYTFQIMSYVIDAYFNRVKVQRKFYLLLTYTSLFPQLIAGPIVRYETIENELENRKETITEFNLGIRRFIIGLGKKVIIANNVALLATHVFNEIVPMDLTFTFAWLGVIAYTLQIYFDFSAYSDMAIGLGQIFGFHFLENFNYPYTAQSITDFWRRWHISLSTWFRDFVYIPLGGNRVSQHRLIINIFVVWFLTGLWHGASWNFVIWGLYFGVLLIIEKLFLEKIIARLPIMRNIYVIFIVMIGWVIFNTNNLEHFYYFISSLLNFEQGFDFKKLQYSQYLYVWPYLILACIGSTPLVKNIGAILKKHWLGELLIEVLLFIIVFLTITFLVNDSYNPFIYFRF